MWDVSLSTTSDRLSEIDAGNKAAVDRLLACLRMMIRIRLFEVAAENAGAAGRIRGMIHSAVGQEAVAAGVCINLRTSDLVTSTHRNHHHALAKGVDPVGAMAELFGRATGVCGGKGGSMHIADFAVGMIGANGVVGASVVLAAGAAQAFLRRGSDDLAVAFFGDGGINRGQCLEAMNYAAVFRLPLLLVCEDNGWAATTPADSVTAGPGILARAEALGLQAAEVDGNDVEAVDRLTGAQVASIRGGAGPQLLLCRTYRWRGHTAVDPAHYRNAGEHEMRMRDDPIARCETRLRALGLNDAIIARAHAEEDQNIRNAVIAAEQAAEPLAQDALTDVQDTDMRIAS